MNQSEQKILIQRAVKLVRLGRKLEMERKNLHELVKQEYPYDSAQVHETLCSFLSLQKEWKELENEHLKAIKALQKHSRYHCQAADARRMDTLRSVISLNLSNFCRREY